MHPLTSWMRALQARPGPLRSIGTSIITPKAGITTSQYTIRLITAASNHQTMQALS